MNIYSIGSSLRYDPYNAPVKYGNGSFLEMLTAQQKLKEGVEAPEYVSVEASFPYGEKQILRVDAIDDQGRTQSIRAEYTADSTAEDPVVMLYGTSYYGDYRYTRRLRDIDLRNCTYPEMYALLAHEKALTMERTGGQPDETAAYTNEVTLDKLAEELPAGDFMKERNFLDEYARSHQQLKISIDIQISADEKITMEHRVDTSAEDAAAAAEFERLMRTVDQFIEDIKEDAEVRAEKAEKEKMEELFQTERDEYERLAEQTDAENILEGLL